MQSQEAKKGHVTYGSGVTGRRLRMPLLRAKGGSLRILIYARYSTEEQNPRSIQDQFGYCRHLLDWNAKSYRIIRSKRNRMPKSQANM